MADESHKQKLLNQFLVEHAPLINLHVKKLQREGKIGPHIDPTDLHEAGFHGLVEALHRYDPNVGAAFGTYAGTRIRGKMLDHVVSSGEVPKTLQTRAKNLKALQSQKKDPSDPQSQ